MKNDRQPVFTSISILRGICVIFVILYHFTSRYNNKSEIIQIGATINWPIDIWWGCGAVATFFMMSGFLVGRYFVNGYITSRAYLTNRAFRLYPTFWVGVLITYITVNTFFPEANVGIKAMIVNLTMIPYFFGQPCVDGAYWTMQVEFFFSILMGCIFFLSSYRIRKTLLVAWMLLTLVFFFIPSDIMIIRAIKFIFTPHYAHMFIAGIASYLILKNGYSKFSVTLLSLCVINQLLYSETNSYNIFFIITLFVFIFTNYIDKYINKENWIVKIFSFFAMISYSWYLIHQMIGYIIIKECILTGLDSEWIILFALIATGFIAYLLNRFVEKPSAKIGKQLSSHFLNK